MPTRLPCRLSFRRLVAHRLHYRLKSIPGCKRYCRLRDYLTDVGKYWELARSRDALFPTGISWSVNGHFANMDTWNKLSAGQQETRGSIQEVEESFGIWLVTTRVMRTVATLAGRVRTSKFNHDPRQTFRCRQGALGEGEFNGRFAHLGEKL